MNQTTKPSHGHGAPGAAAIGPREGENLATTFWLTTTPSPSLFFVSIDSKGFNFSVSPLESTLGGDVVSVDSKELVCTES
jgi:hypothetical protein